MKKLILAITIVLFIQPSSAADSTSQESTSMQGQLFTIKLTPGEKSLKVFVTGTKMAQLSIEETTLVAYVRSGSGFRRLPVNKTKDAYLIQPAPSTDSQLKLEIKSPKGEESFEVSTPK